MSKDRPDIRFMGYAIPTTPGSLVPISSSGPGGVAGTYLGDCDVATDLGFRIAVLKNAVDTAKALLPAGEDPGSVINLFLAPEFFFHGVQGPYIYASEADDPADAILRRLVETFPACDYPNWTFVFGSVTTAQLDAFDRVCEANSTTVRN
ncbi:MAG TPA: hypothetical protein VLX28_04845, partial [Thermoanaerobaculia bacterium]|nr:hypothetical protein [Thermoanaerobaculia bacterium]